MTSADNDSTPETEKIPLVDLSLAHAAIADEVLAGFERVIKETAFIDGPDVAAFEREFAAFCGAAETVGVANGTDAIELALRAAGIGDGDEVLLPTNSFVATAEAVARAGAVPRLVDCDPDALLIDPELVVDALTPKTRAVVPVHLYGQCAPVEQFARQVGDAGVLVIEDAAQAQGARRNGRGIGSFGIAAATSFYPGKNLGAYGDAGAVITNDAEIAKRVRAIRNHGSDRRYQHDVFGFNSRLDTLQAVVLRAKLTHLEAGNASRRQAADRYDELLAGVGDTVDIGRPSVLDGNLPVWHLYVVRVPRRDEVIERLWSNGIGAGIHYRMPIHLQPAFGSLGYRVGDFPVAEAAAEEILSLPLFPGITEGQQQRVVDALRDALRD